MGIIIIGANMKKILSVGKTLAVLVVIALLVSCKNTGSVADKADASVMDKDTSYAFGMAIAAGFKDMDLKFDYASLTQGFRDYLEGKKTKYTENDAMAKVQTAYATAIDAKSQNSKQQETDFFAENAKKSGIKTTVSGLQYEVISEGNGPKPLSTDMVQVNYEGKLIDGTIFDSSYQRGEPVEFPLDAVIPGWTEGLQLMSEGSAYNFYIPSNLAYGENGAGATIPPYSTLIFKVELLAIVKK
jgi:FKBP-type peptidyl-prolyl cis-trans isomerase FkpA